MSVRIGDDVIPKKYGPRLSTIGGSGLSLSVSILGDQEIISKLNSLKEKVYEIESINYTGLAKINDIKPPRREELGDQFVTHFYFTMTRIP